MTDGESNELMRARAAAAYLGWKPTDAAGRRLRRRVLRLETHAGRPLFPRNDLGHIEYTPRLLQRHFGDLMLARFVAAQRTITHSLDEMRGQLSRELDRRIENHPVIREHERRLDRHDTQLLSLSDAVSLQTEVLGQLTKLECGELTDGEDPAELPTTE